MWLRPLNNIGYAGDVWDKIGYTMDEFFEFWKESLDYIIQKNMKEGEDRAEMMTLLFTKKILSMRDPKMLDIMSPCGAGIGQLLYKYNGDIHTCDEGKIFDEFKLGNVFEDSYSDILSNEKVISMIDVSSKQNYLCNNCEWEAFCGVCPVYTYASQGSIVSKLSMDDKCELYGRITEKIFEKILYSKEDREVLSTWYKEDKVFD